MASARLLVLLFLGNRSGPNNKQIRPMSGKGSSSCSFLLVFFNLNYLTPLIDHYGGNYLPGFWEHPFESGDIY